MNRTVPLSTLIVCLWTGGMWTVCGIVVPGLFWLIPDTKQAGNVAAQFFYVEVGLGALLGMMYWLLRRRAISSSTQRWLWAAVAAPVLFFVVLKPLMASARAAGDMARFGQLHGAASLLFLVACVGSGVVAWRHLLPSLTRPAE
jgi:hypothetical protein